MKMQVRLCTVSLERPPHVLVVRLVSTKQIPSSVSFFSLTQVYITLWNSAHSVSTAWAKLKSDPVSDAEKARPRMIAWIKSFVLKWTLQFLASLHNSDKSTLNFCFPDIFSMSLGCPCPSQMWEGQFSSHMIACCVTESLGLIAKVECIIYT